jgi:hypothetical protein
LSTDSGVAEEKMRVMLQNLTTVLNKYTWQEITIVVFLALLFGVGLTVIVFGLLVNHWLTIPGGILDLAILLPLNKLIELRRANIALLISAEVFRFMRADQAEQEAIQLLGKLRERI